jgi:hypothetical protein
MRSWKFASGCVAILGLVACGAAAGDAAEGEVLAQSEAELAATPMGATDCRYGDADCNVCANDVQTQFFAAFDDDALDWKTWKWHFHFNDRIVPDDDEPGDVLATGFSNHVQGFVRTNNDDIRYAVSHDADSGDNGAFFFIQRGPERNTLKAMHRSSVAHPVSVFEIGQYVGSAEGPKMRMFDVRRITSDQNYSWGVGIAGANTEIGGGGLGMAKLEDGAHLLVVSGKGGDKDPDTSPRRTKFFRVEGPLTRPTRVTPKGDVVYSQNPDWSGDYRFSDNLSVITECGTGRLYTIHVAGEESLNGKGYWRLSRVDGTADGGYTLKTLAGRWQSQDNDNCWLRGGASAHVNKAHDIELYCHERKAVKAPFENDDYMTFKWGGPKAK